MIYILCVLSFLFGFFMCALFTVGKRADERLTTRCDTDGTNCSNLKRIKTTSEAMFDIETILINADLQYEVRYDPMVDRWYVQFYHATKEELNDGTSEKM